MSRKWKNLPELIKSLRLTKAEVDAIVGAELEAVVDTHEDFIFDPTPLKLKGPSDYSNVDALLAAMKKDLH